MPSPLRFPLCIAPVLLAGLPFLGCMGRVDPNVGDPLSGGGSSSGTSSSGGGSPGGSSSGGIGSSSGISSSSSSGGVGSSSGVSSSGGIGSSSGISSSSGGFGSSSGISSSSSSGGVGDPDCSLLAVPNLARVCPDGTSVGGQYVLSNHQCVLEFLCPPIAPPPGGPCTQGGVCSPGSGCGSVSTNPNACTSSCNCDKTGHYQCSQSCPPPTPVGCTQGAACMPGEGCGGGSSGGPGGGGCQFSCNCNAMGFFDCSTDCPDAGPTPDPCPGFPVPDICQVCSNGTTECAHAILVKGQCEVEICPGG